MLSSKEALKYLLVNSEELYTQYEEDEKFYLDAVELYNIVLKDLEVLEILKKVFNYKSVQKFIEDMAKFYNVNEKTIIRQAKRLKLNRKGVSTIERVS